MSDGGQGVDRHTSEQAGRESGPRADQLPETPSPSVTDPVDRHFGEEGAQLTYGSYLRIPALLSQQVPMASPPAHDELLFIVVHQTYELWFTQILHELERARAAMDAGQLWWALHLLRRVSTIEDLLVRQVDVIETMTPQDFLEFRQALAPASGFQSVQFREIEFISGHKDPGFLRRFRGLTEGESQRLRRRLEEPTLWDAFVGVLSRAGLSAQDDAALTASLLQVARNRGEYGEAWDVAEGLLQHDEQQAAWRARHVRMVERQIGTKSGTGGSTGAPYLRSRLDLHFYPLLWELRDVM